VLPLSRLRRLADRLANAEGEVACRLLFARDGDGKGVIHGEIRATLQLVCQRCMSPVAWSIDEAFTLVPVQSIEEANLLPDHYEPLLLGEAMVRPAEILEDELLLALPQIAMHGTGDCALQVDTTVEKGRGNGRSGSTHPFTALAALKGGSGD
jgi:uncharacterized protein